MDGPKRTRRRVRTDPAPGSDPAPQSSQPVTASEDDERRWGSGAADRNEQRLREDKPPHY